MNFTTVIVSFKSSHLLEKNIQSIEKKKPNYNYRKFIRCIDKNKIRKII